jgi:hypothetical protein
MDLSITDIRDVQTELGIITMELYFQFGTAGKGVAWLGEKGKIVDAVFKLPRRVMEIGLAIRAAAPTSQQNKEAKKQNSIALFNLMVQLYERLLPLIGQIAPEAMPIVAGALVTSARKYMHSTLAAFDEPDPDEVLAGLAVLERILPAAEDLGGMEAFERRAETSKILDQLGGLEDLLRQAEANASGLDRLPPERNGGSRVEGAQGVLPGSRTGPRTSGPPSLRRDS